MNFLNPWILLSMLAAIAGAYTVGHHTGYKQKTIEDTLLIAAKDQKLNDAKEKADAELSAAKDQLEAKDKQLLDAIHSGSQRMYVRVAAQPASAAASSGDSPTTAQLDPAFAESLVAIANEGDRAIVLLNSCIERYDQVRTDLDGNR